MLSLTILSATVHATTFRNLSDLSDGFPTRSGKSFYIISRCGHVSPTEE